MPVPKGYTERRLGPKPKRVSRWRWITRGTTKVLVAFTPGPNGKGHAVKALVKKGKK